jgi:hypothetical protein
MSLLSNKSEDEIRFEVSQAKWLAFKLLILATILTLIFL